MVGSHTYVYTLPAFFTGMGHSLYEINQKKAKMPNFRLMNEIGLELLHINDKKMATFS